MMTDDGSRARDGGDDDRARDGATGGRKTYEGGNAAAMQKPATVKMLKKAVDSKQAPEDEFKLNGEAILNVTVVGKVIEASRKAAYIMYKVDDGTGVCDVKVWSESDSVEELAAVGAYVRVYGSLKTFSNEVMISGHSEHAVRTITDFNEITFHMLEVVYSSGFAAKKATMGGEVPTSAYTVPTAQNTAVTGDQASADISTAIIGVLRAGSNGEEGMHIDKIAEALNGRFTRDAVEQAIQDMANDGTAFNTSDDFHFALVD